MRAAWLRLRLRHWLCTAYFSARKGIESCVYIYVCTIQNKDKYPSHRQRRRIERAPVSHTLISCSGKGTEVGKHFGERRTAPVPSKMGTVSGRRSQSIRQEEVSVGEGRRGRGRVGVRVRGGASCIIAADILVGLGILLMLLRTRHKESKRSQACWRGRRANWGSMMGCMNGRAREDAHFAVHALFRPSPTATYTSSL